MIGARKPIKIVSVTPDIDFSTGHAKAGETLIWEGWAEVTNPNSNRRFFSGQDSLEHTKFFKIRNNLEISHDVDTRLIYAGKRYTVNSIEREDEKKFYWIIRATAQSAG
jgi:head-tail adaptor